MARVYGSVMPPVRCWLASAITRTRPVGTHCAMLLYLAHLAPSRRNRSSQDVLFATSSIVNSVHIHGRAGKVGGCGVSRVRQPLRRAGAAGVVALVVALAACGGGSATPRQLASSHSPGRHAEAIRSATPAPSAPATRIVSYPVRVGAYRLVNKDDRPVAKTWQSRKFLRNFSFAATAQSGFYLPGHKARQDVYLTARQLARETAPATAIQDYLGEFEGQELHLTSEPAGPLGGQVKCWESGGITFCMWADNGTYGLFLYQPPFGLDTALIRHLAAAVPVFRRAMERAKP
jgi:hypothetical protein